MCRPHALHGTLPAAPNLDFPAQGSAGDPTWAGVEAPLAHPSALSESAAVSVFGISLEKMAHAHRMDTTSAALMCEAHCHFFWAGVDVCCCGLVRR